MNAMYEAKFNKYITKSHSRFAEPDEIVAGLQRLEPNGKCYAGVPIYYDGETLFVDKSESHTIGIGPTGCKKTRTLVIPTVNSIIASGESAIINDPKGEIYHKTGGFAKRCGSKVLVLNFRKPSASHGWNPLSLCYKYYQTGDEEAA